MGENDQRESSGGDGNAAVGVGLVDAALKAWWEELLECAGSRSCTS